MWLALTVLCTGCTNTTACRDHARETYPAYRVSDIASFNLSVSSALEIIVYNNQTRALQCPSVACPEDISGSTVRRHIHAQHVAAWLGITPSDAASYPIPNPPTSIRPFAGLGWGLQRRRNIVRNVSKIYHIPLPDKPAGTAQPTSSLGHCKGVQVLEVPPVRQAETPPNH